MKDNHESSLESGGEYELLVDYLSGSASPEGRADVEARAAVDPRFRAMLDESRLIWDRVPLALASRSVTPKPLKLPPRVPHQRRASRRVRTILAVAAIVLIMVIPTIMSLPRGEPPASAGTVAVREYRSGANQRVRIPLDDGSVVELGANSRVWVPEPFDVAARELELEGIAFFEITPDADRPFLVQAGNATTRVLGTKFAVQAYGSDGEVRVAVTEGRVTIGRRASSARDGAVLTAGQVGLLATDGVPRVIQDQRQFDRLVDWTDGQREYTDVPLAEILADLERWYGQRLLVPDPALGARPVSTVLKGEPLDQVLRLIALVVDAQYERRGSTIVFTPRQSVSR